MKKALLSIFVVFLVAFAGHAQLNDCDGCGDSQYGANDDSSRTTISYDKPTKRKKVSVFPNPAVDFIGISKEDEKSVSKIVVLNVMGRTAKNFKIEKGMRYDVSDLKRGMYLVQIFDLKNDIITTQRLNKN